MRIKYFAYGSNMHKTRMLERVPSAVFQTVASLSGYSLAFHKSGDDGSGKCSITEQAGALSPVLGVIYDIDSSEKPILDQCESLGAGYKILELDVYAGTESYSVFTYCAMSEWVDDSLIPYDWYKALVLTGAIDAQLPKQYLQLLESQVDMPDLDAERAALHKAILLKA